MSRSVMKPEYYLSEEIYAREQEHIFRRLWLFFGLKTMLAGHNSFIARTIAGLPVVVQNFHGELRAFENVCLHRQNALQWEDAGRRPLACRYHGWSYDAEGRPASIPSHDEIYRYGEEERRGLRLKRYALEVIGNLVFINLAAQPLPITEQFSRDLIDTLASSSGAYDGEVLVARVRTAFNWKLAYENLRDGNHPRYVHAQTLFKHVNFQPGLDEDQHRRAEEVCTAAGDWSIEARLELLRRFSWGGPDTRLNRLLPLEWHGMVERWGDQDYYYNWLAYPNLHIASGSGGYSFTIEQHNPVSPGCTELVVYWLTAKKKRPYAAMPAVLLASLTGGYQVLAEDIKVMEMVQRSLHPGAPLPRQGDYEYMNRMVEKWYADLMEGRFEI